MFDVRYSRRGLLVGFGASALGGALLAACANAGNAPGTPYQVSQQVINDVDLIASGIQAELPVILAGVPNLTPAMSAKITASVGDLQKAAAALVVSTSLTMTQSTFQQVAADVAAVAAAVGPAVMLANPAIGAGIEAAAVLIQVIATSLQTTAPVVPVPAVPAPGQSAVGAPLMTAVDARGVLTALIASAR